MARGNVLRPSSPQEGWIRDRVDRRVAGCADRRGRARGARLFQSFFPLDSFYGYQGAAQSRPIRFVEYRIAENQSTPPLTLDDLGVLVPEPHGGWLGLAAALGLGAIRARRSRIASAPPQLG